MSNPINDPYLDPQSGVLKNRAEITDAAALKEHETLMSGTERLRWALKPEINTYDLAHVQKIHQRLYAETYDWAGKTRTVDMERNGIAHTDHRQIEASSKALFAQLQAEKRTLDKASPEVFAARAGHYMGEMTRLQPFREGNILTQKVFMSQMAKDAGYNIEWQKMDRVQMEKAQAEAMRGNHKPFEAMFKDHLKERSIEARMKDGRPDKDVAAIKVIQTNRESLDRMERSYPASNEKQGEISTARVMLNSMEFAVRNRSPEVALTRDPSAPAKANKDFEAIPSHISSKNSLVMVKQSIHAVERAGTTVHHEMSQQWKSKQSHELQVGHDKTR